MRLFIVGCLIVACIGGCGRGKSAASAPAQPPVDVAAAKARLEGMKKSGSKDAEPASPGGASPAAATGAEPAAVIGGVRAYIHPSRQWDKVPAYLDDSAIAYGPKLNRREEAATKTLQVQVKQPTQLLAVVSTPEIDPTPGQASTDVPKERMATDGWAAVGTLVGPDKHTAVIYRKAFNSGDSITYPSMVTEAMPMYFVIPTGASVAAIEALTPIDPIVSALDGAAAVSNVAAASEAPAGGAPAEGSPAAEGTPAPAVATMQPGQLAVLKGRLGGKGKGDDDEPAPALPAAPGAPGIPGVAPGFGPAAPRQLSPEEIVAGKLQGTKCIVTGQAVSPEFSATYLKGKVFFASEVARGEFEGDRNEYSAQANYQLFITGQAVQVKCPITNRDFDSQLAVDMGGHAVYFATEAGKNKVERAQGNAKYTQVFKDRPFKKAFEIHPEYLASNRPVGPGGRMSDAEAAMRAQMLSRMMGQMFGAEEFGEKLAGAITSDSPFDAQQPAGGSLRFGKGIGLPGADDDEGKGNGGAFAPPAGNPGLTAPPATNPPPAIPSFGGKGKKDRD